MIRVDQCNSSWSSTAKRWNASLFSTIWRKMSRGEYTRFFSGVAVLTTKVTTTLSLRSECSTLNILIAIAVNMVIVYFVLKYVYKVEHWLGKTGIYIIRKFFGVILLAMSVKLVVTNLMPLLK